MNEELITTRAAQGPSLRWTHFAMSLITHLRKQQIFFCIMPQWGKEKKNFFIGDQTPPNSG